MCSGNHCIWASHTPQQVYLEQNKDHAPHIVERVKDTLNILSLQDWVRFHLSNPHSHPNSATYEKMSSSQQETTKFPSHDHNFSWGRSPITGQTLRSYQLHQYRASLNSEFHLAVRRVSSHLTSLAHTFLQDLWRAECCLNWTENWTNI